MSLAVSVASGASASAVPPGLAVAPFDAAGARRHQGAWAKHVGAPIEESNSVGMTLVLIPPGEFQMGSTPEQVKGALELLAKTPRQAAGEEKRIREEEGFPHRVVLTRPIRLGRTEVTIGQYRQFVAATHYVTETERFGGGNSGLTNETDPRKKDISWKAPGYKVTDESPVTQLTWNDMMVFANWLSGHEGREACYRLTGGVWTRIAGANGYRLPTEAEWEFACRAGTTTHYSFGDDVRDLDEYAWYNRTAETKGQVGARAVATKRPNPFGLYDMHGNAWEMCQDFWDPHAYRKSRLEDPEGPATGSNHIARGAGWHYFDLHARSAYRNNYAPNGRTGNKGFRLVRGI